MIILLFVIVKEPILSSSQIPPSIGEKNYSRPSLFAGKVIAISGAGSGIGLATTTYLYFLVARLSLLDNREEVLEEAVKAIEQNSPLTKPDVVGAQSILVTVADVRDSKQIDAWIERTVSQFGGLDGATNLAGVIGRTVSVSNITEVSDEEWLFVNDVTLN